MTIEAVLFDWGGTLSLDANADLLDLWRAAAAALAPDHADDLARALLTAEQDFFDRTSPDVSRTTSELIHEAGRAVGVDLDAALHDPALEAYLDAWTPHVRHDPDGGPLLEELAARGLRTGLLSNTHWPRRWHEHFLERDGLADLLGPRVYTSELAVRKPHPAAFRALLDAVGVPAERAVFVGDRLYDDVFGAHTAGLRAAVHRRAATPPYDVTPDASIDRLPELLDLLDRW